VSVDRLSLIASNVEQIIGSEHDSFGTFEVVGNDKLWLQYTPGTINAAYPHDEPPHDRLAALGFVDVQEWVKGEYTTADLAFDKADDIAGWIDRYFCEVLGCDAGYDLRVELCL
jgi:hypothetical protein